MFMSDIITGWKGAVRDRLEQLIRLEEGWDGYTGFPVSFVNANFAFHMLESICRHDTPPPQIVPGASGDLQIEWHTDAGDIELWVHGPNDVLAWREISKTRECEELNLTTDFSAVSDWVKQITEPGIAIAATA
jgi:hypothetical protein